MKWLNMLVPTVPCSQLVDLVDDLDINEYRSTERLEKKQKWFLQSQPPLRRKRPRYFLYAFVFTLEEVKFYLFFDNFTVFYPCEVNEHVFLCF